MNQTYTQILNRFFSERKFPETIFNKLVKAGPKIHPSLVKGLLNNQNANVRHWCAHLLGERGLARAIPALIEALKDDQMFVRQDAFWAIERLSGFQPGRLQELLSTSPNFGKPKTLYLRTKAWWRANKKFIENNESIW